MDDNPVNDSRENPRAEQSDAAPADGVVKSGYHQMSVEEAEKAAARFKPIWEHDEITPTQTPKPQSSRTGSSAAGVPHQSVDTNNDAPPISSRIIAPARAVTDERAIEDSPNDHQGPVDIVAAIPKRADVQIKDEPSVVVPMEDPGNSEPLEPFPPTRKIPFETVVPPTPAPKPWLKVGAIAGAAAVVLVVGVALLFRQSSKPVAQIAPVATENTITSVESLPPVTTEVVTPSEPTMKKVADQPSAQPKQPTANQDLKHRDTDPTAAQARPTAMASADDTGNTDNTVAKQTAAPTTPTQQPASTPEHKPTPRPKTTKQPPPKPTSGDIVREIPQF